MTPVQAIRFATAISAAAVAPPALAQIDVPDEIADGLYVTLAEIRANSEETFRLFAGPDGGPVARKEFVATDLPASIGPAGSDRQLLARLFGRLDADGDGRLTRAEWNQRIERDLKFADQNDDGRVTLKELSNARRNMSFGDALGMMF